MNTANTLGGFFRAPVHGHRGQSTAAAAAGTAGRVANETLKQAGGARWGGSGRTGRGAAVPTDNAGNKRPPPRWAPMAESPTVCSNKRDGRGGAATAARRERVNSLCETKRLTVPRETEVIVRQN